MLTITQSQKKTDVNKHNVKKSGFFIIHNGNEQFIIRVGGDTTFVVEKSKIKDNVFEKKNIFITYLYVGYAYKTLSE